MNRTPPTWHTLSPEETAAQLETSLQGLNNAEAADRLMEYGPNELQATKGKPAWRLLLEQFENVLIIMLLIAAVVSGFLGDTTEAIAIGVIVVFAAGLGFIQEYRAGRAIEALREMAAPVATVIRGGHSMQIPARELVPGDLVNLHTGDRVPADARVVSEANLKVEEAALTGESMAIEKQVEALSDANAALGDRSNMVYGGTSISYGRGEALVTATGMNTEFGMIAGMLQTVESGDTPLQENLDQVGKVLAQAALAIVAVIFILGVIQGNEWGEMFIFAIALAVAAVPEALPAVVTISLAIGVQRMVRRNALIRSLPAVETLGSTSVICSDKTGTLTKDEMTVRQIYLAGQILSVSGAGYTPEGKITQGETALTTEDANLRMLLQGGALCNDSHLVKEDGMWDIQGDPTEGALVVAAAKAGLDKFSLDDEFTRVKEIPFSSETKRMTTIHATGNGRMAYSKGAPEILVESCTHVLAGDGNPVALDEAGRDTIRQAAQGMASQAMRVLALACKPVNEDDPVREAQEAMTFVGLFGMIDPPRPEARKAISMCSAAGIKTVMITGDHQVTAKAVAKELGLLKTGRTVTGAELEDMTDAEFNREVEAIEVYARVSPAHKLRIVTALKNKGHIVAMTGDGVNDAPSLKKADIGIAMGITGTDVTKEAADMMLTDDNFASIVAAVEEGRGIFGNIKKYLMYLLSANIGEMMIMGVATLIGLPLPLTAVQLLYINLATDGLPALALAVDPPEDDIMIRPPRNARTGIFTRPVIALMLFGGVWSTIVNVGLFTWAIGQRYPMDEARSMIFVCLVLIEFFKAYAFRSDHLSSFLHPFANKWLNRAIIWESILLGLILYLPFLHGVFDTFSLTFADWLIVLPLALTIFPVLEVGKWLVRRETFGSLDG